MTFERSATGPRIRNVVIVLAFALTGVIVARACRGHGASAPPPASAPAPAAPIEAPVTQTPAELRGSVADEKPLPGDDIWPLLERCMKDKARWWRVEITVEQVRHWVLVERDPVWYEGPPRHGAWWLPLSGEGEAQMPSGLYVSVPVDGAPCGGAIVN